MNEAKSNVGSVILTKLPLPWNLLTQVVEAVGNHARFLLQLYPLFVNSLGDGEDEVCSNAVFGLGVLAANALPDIQT